jgi:hypothetical protein
VERPRRCLPAPVNVAPPNSDMNVETIKGISTVAVLSSVHQESNGMPFMKQRQERALWPSKHMQAHKLSFSALPDNVMCS